MTNTNRHGQRWSRQELLIAFGLYCKISFGKVNARNPEIIRAAAVIGRTPSSLAMKLANIASLDSKITSTGRSGLSGASKVDREMWEEMHNWGSFIPVAEQALAEVAMIAKGGSEKESGRIRIGHDENVSYEGVDRETSSTTRVGQDLFRASVMSAYDNRCCITRLPIPVFLVASHIVPWSKNTKDRLNPSNGLSLSVIHDKAFDRGLITISENMSVVLSSEIEGVDNDFFRAAIQNYEGKEIAMPEKFPPRQDFLEYHRNNVFQQ
ncbi:MAG: HNH endonuclease [Gammaproteobacteria bacterium]